VKKVILKLGYKHKACYIYITIKQTGIMTLDQRLNGLKKGESIITSEGNGITCTAERSTDGKVIRFVRTFSDGSWTVYHTSRFNKA
jgi:hypothetical protein